MTLDEYLGLDARDSGRGQEVSGPQGRAEGVGVQPVAQAIEAPTEDDIKRYGYADVYKHWQQQQQQPDYEAQEERQRKAATLALIGEVAQLGAQMFAAGRGMRRFQPIQNNVQNHLSAIDKIREARLAYQQNASNGLLDAMYRDLAGKKQEEAAQDARNYQNERDKQAHQWQVELNNSNQEFQAKQREAQQRYQTKEREAQQRYQAAAREAQQQYEKSGKGRYGGGESAIKAWAYGNDGMTYVLGDDINTQMVSVLIQKHKSDIPREAYDSYTNAWDNDTKARAATNAIGYLLGNSKLSGRELRSLGFSPSGESNNIPFRGEDENKSYLDNAIQKLIGQARGSGRNAKNNNWASDLTFD